MCVRVNVCGRKRDGQMGCLFLCMCVCLYVCMRVCLHAFEEFLVAGRRRSLNLSSGSTSETRELEAAEGAGHK